MGKKTLLTLVLGPLMLFQLSGQTVFQGRVLDDTTREPIAYVNIGIVDLGIGTVSDEEGVFLMKFNANKLQPLTTILFSALGYETLNFPITKISEQGIANQDILLVPKALELNEVVVSNKGEEFIQDNVGYRNFGERSYGYWKDNVAEGGELATRVVVKDGLRKLEQLSFQVWHNPSDSLLLRVNVYDDDGGISRLPGTPLNKSGKSIFCTIKKSKEGTNELVKVDLKPYDIYVTDDFIISLELLEVYGPTALGLVIPAAFNQYGSYRRYSSQDKWVKFTDTNMAYYVESSLLVSKKQAERFQRKLERKEKKSPTIAGFAISKGKMIPKVTVINNDTGESTETDAQGRYRLAAQKKDIIIFRKEGYKDLNLIVGEKPTMNARLQEQ